MSDFVFSTIQTLPACWHIVHQSSHYQLAVRDDTGPNAFHWIRQNHTIIAYLNNTDSEILTPAGFAHPSFLEDIGVCTGILWHIDSDEFCLFRDMFGLIPCLFTPKRGLLTTNPDFHAEIHHNSKINPKWFAQFLLSSTETFKDDVFEDTERILPGEMRYWVTTTPEDFLSAIVHDQPRAQGMVKSLSHILWNTYQWRPLTDSRINIADELRHEIIEAANRIPAANPCFTLSGGLDSSGIVSSYLQTHTGPVDAVTLISRKHKRCDESHEIDVLEAALPIHVRRLAMDDAWPLSQPDLYHTCRGYGPLCSPGIETVVNLYRLIESELGPRTIITGYGGNSLVKVRPEALWMHLFRHPDIKAFLKELSAIDQNIALSRRVLGNLAHGRIRRLYRFIRARSDINDPIHWIQPGVLKRYPPEQTDPIFFTSHIQERILLPTTWEWEMQSREKDILMRQTHHHFHDVLLDFKLYRYCARIPPQYFLEGGHYRPIYKEALAKLLPSEIIHHPKVQSFDDLMHDGLSRYGRDYLRHAIENATGLEEIIDRKALLHHYECYCQTVQEGSSFPIMGLWKALASMIWAL